MSAARAKLAAAGAVALMMASGSHPGHHHHGFGGVLDAMGAAPTGSHASWARAELRTLGFPRTPADVTSLVAWQAREGGGGANNPLNSTEPAPGATIFNSVGVRNYPSAAEGVAATAVTMRNGNYADVLSALASGHGLCGESFAGLSTWSGGGYSQVC
jgi:hypothetical protein